MKLHQPSFNKLEPSPAFLRRPALRPKPEPIVALPRRFRGAERHIIAKAWASGALCNERILKAQRSEALAKRAAVAAKSDALIKADLAKVDDMLWKVEQFSARLDIIEASFAAERRTDEMRGRLQ
jgi:hypothetical protein